MSIVWLLCYYYVIIAWLVCYYCVISVWLSCDHMLLVGDYRVIVVLLLCD